MCIFNVRDTTSSNDKFIQETVKLHVKQTNFTLQEAHFYFYLYNIFEMYLSLTFYTK